MLVNCYVRAEAMKCKGIFVSTGILSNALPAAITALVLFEFSYPIVGLLLPL